MLQWKLLWMENKEKRQYLFKGNWSQESGIKNQEKKNWKDGKKQDEKVKKGRFLNLSSLLLPQKLICKHVTLL